MNKNASVYAIIWFSMRTSTSAKVPCGHFLFNAYKTCGQKVEVMMPISMYKSSYSNTRELVFNEAMYAFSLQHGFLYGCTTNILHPKSFRTKTHKV